MIKVENVSKEYELDDGTKITALSTELDAFTFELIEQN